MTGTQSQTVTDPDTDWANRGRCRDHDNPDLWFPVSYERDRAQVEEAKDECRKCPVTAKCLEWAKATNQADGIWGGLTPSQRAAPRAHGSYGGFKSHMRRRERACEPCRAERSEHQVASAAKRICRACPVITQCLEYALANDEMHGIWGGVSERARRRMRMQRGEAA